MPSHAGRLAQSTLFQKGELPWPSFHPDEVVIGRGTQPASASLSMSRINSLYVTSSSIPSESPVESSIL